MATSTGTLGTNISYSVDAKGIVTLTIDTKQRHGESASGKSTVVASTGGNMTLPGTDVVFGINAYVKKPKNA